MSNSQDSFGFQTEYEYDRKKDYQSTPSNVSTKKVIYMILIGTLVLFWLVSAMIAGRYAWNEFPNDTNLVKLVRLWIAVVFSPLYIFYIFIKTTVFKQQ
jgi:hypothetical protein